MSAELDPRIAAAVHGDRDALAALLHEHGAEVRRRIAAETPADLSATFDIDDVMQITYLEAFLRIGRFDPPRTAEFVAWLTRIARNNLIDALRELRAAKRPPPARRQYGPAEAELSSVAFLEGLGWTSTTPSRQAAAGEMHAELRAALGRLPPDYRRVIELYELEGRTVAATAAALDRSEGAVFMLRARAMDRLREILAISGGISGSA